MQSVTDASMNSPAQDRGKRTLLAARRVREIKGLVRGLDTLLFGATQT